MGKQTKKPVTGKNATGSNKEKASQGSGRATKSVKRTSSAKKKLSLWARLKKLFTRRKSDKRKIYKTTDGYFTQNPNITKRRRVAIVKQRQDDGALAVTKIYSKDEKRTGEQYIEGLVLSPKKHSSLTKTSIVGSKVIVGTKDKDKNYKAIYKGDLEPTGDKLTKKEHRTIMENLGGGNEQYKKTSEDLLEKWEKHFKQ